MKCWCLAPESLPLRSAQAVQLPTADVVDDPLLWLRCMSRFGVTHSWAPNFGFKLVVAALRESASGLGLKLGECDLTSVRRLMNAGEQVANHYSGPSTSCTLMAAHYDCSFMAAHSRRLTMTAHCSLLTAHYSPLPAPLLTAQ